MAKENNHNIYVRFLDGTFAFYPAKGTRLNDGTYRIETIREFDPEDTSTLFEFIPGDVVPTKLHKYSNRRLNHERATYLIHPSNHPLKGYSEFLYKAAENRITLNLDAAKKHKGHIRQVQQDAQAGKFFYLAILETVKVLEQLQKDS